MSVRTLTAGVDADWTAPAVDTRGWLVREPGAPGAADAPERPARRARTAPSRRTRRRRAAGRTRPAPGSPELLPGGAGIAIACGPEEAAEGYRLGRWARLALTLTVLSAAVVIGATLWAAPSPQRLVDVTIGPGDTLWGIAAATAPDADPRDVVAQIRELNSMSGDVVRVGEVLRVPAG